MLTLQHPIFKRFYYPLVPVDSFNEQNPQQLKAFDMELVVWLNSKNEPSVLIDKCCHRGIRLSKGMVANDRIRCCYHGWEFNTQGQCEFIPQAPDVCLKQHKVASFPAKIAYGYVWACFSDNPLLDIPHIEEAFDPKYQLFHVCHDLWKINGLRLMENELDQAHPAFVHPNTFGNPISGIMPKTLEVFDIDPYTIKVRTLLPVTNRPVQTRMQQCEENFEDITAFWYMPAVCKVRIEYPNGLVHVLIDMHTPVSHGISIINRFIMRNDWSDIDSVLAFDRQVALEDQLVLEACYDYDFPLDSDAESHITTDKPGLLMRKKLKQLLEEHS